MDVIVAADVVEGGVSTFEVAGDLLDTAESKLEGDSAGLAGWLGDADGVELGSGGGSGKVDICACEATAKATQTPTVPRT